MKRFVSYMRNIPIFSKNLSLQAKWGGDDPGSDENHDETGGSDNDGSGNDRDIRKVSLDGLDTFGFSKISLDHFEKDSSQEEKQVNSQGEKGVDVPADSEKPA